MFGPTETEIGRETIGLGVHLDIMRVQVCFLFLYPTMGTQNVEWNFFNRSSPNFLSPHVNPPIMNPDIQQGCNTREIKCGPKISTLDGATI